MSTQRKYLAALLFGSLVWTTVANAQPASRPAPRDDRATLLVDEKAAAAAASPYVFFRPSLQPIAPGTHEIVVEVKVEDSLYLTERITGTFDAKTAAAPVVELLSLAPRRLAELTGLARNAGKSATITVLLDQHFSRELSLHHLLAASQRLKAEGFIPQAVQSEVIDPHGTPAPPTKRLFAKDQLSCSQDCMAYYYNCTLGCSQCYYCEDERTSCLNECPQDPPQPCTNPVSVTTFDQIDVISSNLISQNCLLGLWGADYYLRFADTYRYTTFRRTLYCNGSTQTVPISFYYLVSSCDVDTGVWCNYPVGYPHC